MRRGLGLAALVPLAASCAPGAHAGAALELLRFRQSGAENVCLNEDLDFFFSEPLDRVSITADSVSIQDERGEAVAGAFRVRETLLSFQPRLPRSSDLSDGGLRPGTRYRVVLGGFPRPDGIRSQDGALLSVTLVLSFETAERDGQHPLFLDPFAGPNPLLPLSQTLGPGDPIRLECGEALDPSTVSGEDFELSRLRSGAERELVRLEAELASNERKRAVLELRPAPLAPAGGGVLEPDDYYLRMVGRGLKTLGGRAAEPGWMFASPLALRVFGPEIGHRTIDFSDERILAPSPEEPLECDGTASWGEGGSGVSIRYPAAAGDGADGRVELGAAPGAADLRATQLSVPAEGQVDLSGHDGLVVLRAQRALEIRGRLVRRTDPELLRGLHEELKALGDEPPVPWPELSGWLVERRARGEPWTVLIAGGDLRVPEGGAIDVDGPLLLIAGGWIRVQGSVQAHEVWRSSDGGGNISARGGRLRLAPLVVYPPRTNPLIEPLHLAVLSKGFAPRRGVTSWRPATVESHAGAGRARVRFLGLPAAEGARAIGPFEDLMQLADCAEVRLLIELEIGPEKGEPWDPPRVERVTLSWNEPLHSTQRSGDAPQ